jgi:tetratricopeptide (TPR) repeat protein
MADRLLAAGHSDHAHLLRARVLHARQIPNAALAECTQVREGGALGRRAAALAGKCLLDLGALNDSDRVFSRLVEQEPDDADAHRGVAAVAYELGQSDRAIDHLQQVIRLDPSDARPYRMLGEIHRDSGDVAAAVAAYREALRLGTGLSPVARDQLRFELVDGLVELSEYAEALAVLDDIPPGAAEPAYMEALRVEALRGLGRPDEARALADRALAAYPEAPFYRLRGQLHLDEGNAQAAIPFLEKAAAMSPHHYQSHFLLARGYAAAGRKADADRASARAEEIRRDYEHIISLSREIADKPWDPEVRLRLAEFFERTGNAKQAAMWRKAAAECQARYR